MSYGVLVLSYLVLAVASVVLLSLLLRRHGKVFIQELFPGRPQTVTALVALLDIGFYLINLGYVALRIGNGPTQAEFELPAGVRIVAEFLGTQYLIIGVLHVFNMALFATRIRFRGGRAEVVPAQGEGPSPALGRD